MTPLTVEYERRPIGSLGICALHVTASGDMPPPSQGAIRRDIRENLGKILATPDDDQTRALALDCTRLGLCGPSWGDGVITGLVEGWVKSGRVVVAALGTRPDRSMLRVRLEALGANVLPPSAGSKELLDYLDR